MNLGVSDETKLKKIEPNTDEYIKELSEELLRFFNTQFVHNRINHPKHNDNDSTIRYQCDHLRKGINYRY